jgi:porphobilinogen synthase
MPYPQVRPRRLRRTPALRALIRETRISPEQLVFPIFVREGIRDAEPISSMPGQFRWPLNQLPHVVRDVRASGISSMMLFGLPARKDELGSGAYDPDGIVQRATQVMKDADPSMLLISDTCLDEYTSHGHCGVWRNGEVDNDATLELLARTAVSQVLAGVDMVAPSDMMDGRVAAIRTALDDSGHTQTSILSYAAKYASAFFGPFREAADCAPQFGDRRSYQMDPANARESVREVLLDVEEGADILMVKPALPYLDIVRRVRETVDVPVAAYNVSGEYAMVKAAVAQGWLDERETVLEILTSITRAGAGIIFTYHACEAARWLTES